MAWTEEDERNFLARRREYFAKEDERDKQRKHSVDSGSLPKCPACGSHRYTEGVLSESCDDCGYGCRY